MNFESKRNLFLKLSLIIFLLIGVINLIIIDVLLYKNNKVIVSSNEKNNNSETANTIIKEDKTLSVNQPTQVPSAVCPVSCITQINEAISSIKLSQPTPVAVKTSAPSETSSSSVKEYYVSFGSGTNSSDDWTDVAGLQAYIDSTKYGQIKNAVFEASVLIPTGNETAYVRLYNVTDKHPVWFSDVSLEGGTAQLLISKAITLDLGNKLYQVQMKTSLKFQANLSQARIHITTY